MATAEENNKLLELAEYFNRKEDISTQEGIDNKISRLIEILTKAQANGESQTLINYLQKQINTLSTLQDKINSFGDKTKNELQVIAGQRRLDTKEIKDVNNFKTVYIKEKERIDELKEAKKYAHKDGDKKIIDEAIAAAIARMAAARKEIRNNTDASEYVDKWIAEGGPEKEKKIQEEILKLKEEALDLDKQSLAEQKANAAALEEGTRKWGWIKSSLKAIWGEIKKGGSTWMDYNDQAISDAKRLGITSTEAAHAYGTAMMESSKGLIRNFGMSMDEAMKMQETFGKITGKATMMSQSQLEDVAAASSLMGKENVAQAIQIMDTMGSTSDRAVELMDKNYARAKNAGLDTAKASEAFVKNMALANRMTFKDGVDGISKMTILSQRLKFNLESVANAADKVSTIEGSIQTAAQLQMLGGSGAMFGSNPMQLLYEGLNDNEALTKRLTETWGTQATFNRKTGEAEVGGLQKQIIKAQAEAYGVSFEDAMNMAKNQAKFQAFDKDNAGIESAIKGRYGEQGSQERIQALQNKAQYSAESGWTITYVDKAGDTQTKSISDVANNDSIMNDVLDDQLDTEEDIKKNVRNIAQQLISLRQEKNAFFDFKNTSYARAVDVPMQTIDNTAKGAMREDGIGSSALDVLGTKFGAGVAMVLTGLFAGVSGWASWKAGKFLKPKLLRGLGGGVKAAETAGEAAEVGKAAKTASSASKVAKGVRGAETVAEATEAARAAEVSTEAVRAGEAAAGVSRFGKIAKTAKTIGSIGKVAKFGKFIKTGGVPIIDVLAAGAMWYGADKEEEAANAQQENISAIESSGNYQQGTGSFRSANLKRDLNFQRNVAKNQAAQADSDKSEAIGMGSGALAGAAAGAAIGSVVPVIGTAVGAAVGGIIGGIAGGFIGKKDVQKEDEGLVSDELKEIEEGDSDDNIKKIVLPVESIDYNVSLIAQQLGVMSAMPARGNVYLQSELAGESSVQTISLGEAINGGYQEQNQALPQYADGGFTGKGGKEDVAGIVHSGEWVASQKLTSNPQIMPILQTLDGMQSNGSNAESNEKSSSYSVYNNQIYNTSAYDVQGEPIQASTVSPVYNNQTYNNGSNSIDGNLTVKGEINLKLDGRSTSLKISDKDLMQIIRNSPDFQRQLAEIITGRQASNGNAGRNNKENADNRRSTTNSTYTGGI